MIEEGRPCVDLAAPLHGVERAVVEAKRVIYDRIDHGGTAGGGPAVVEIKSVTKLL